jgi:pimeloyl-ACP methyl ester carboxylesterase
MNKTCVNGVELEYEVLGSGEPLLLISPVLADGFLPFVSEPALSNRYRLIRYHKRGWGGSTHSPPPVAIADHVVDAAALLSHLEVPRAHIAGHSSGGAIALQMALDRPEMVHSLVLLEPSLLSVPGAEAFLEKAGPALQAYAAGEHEKALAIFMTAVSGLDWNTCQAVIEQRIPGAVAATLADADTFFGVELPALVQWSFDARSASRIPQPALSVLGSETQPLWVEIAALLRSSLPRVEECRIEGVGHLLHIQRPEPVAVAIARFLQRHPIEPQLKRAASASVRPSGPA